MSKITNDDLTRSGTGCFIAVPIIMSTVGVEWHICYLNTIIRYDIRLTSSLQIVFKWHISTIRLYGAIYPSSWWKIQDRKQIKNTDNRHPGKTNSKHSKTKLPHVVLSPFMTLNQETTCAYSTMLWDF